MRIGWPILVLIAAVVAPVAPVTRAAERDPGAIVRTPVALGLAGNHLLVANRRAGMIQIVDVERTWPVGRVAAGRTLSDLVITPDRAHVYVTDEAAGELIQLGPPGRGMRVEARLRVPAYPVSIRLSPRRDVATVASLWSRRVAIVELSAPAMRVRQVVDLPFAPREQIIEPDGTHVFVADAFGGNVARVALATGAVVASRTLEAHNIRGLAWTPDSRELLVAHQTLDAKTPGEASRISWGQVVGNVLRAVPVGQLTPSSSGSATAIARWSLYPLGTNGRGAGDPGALLVMPSGLTVVALSGVNEVAIRPSPLDPFVRIPVGRRPVALVASDDGSRVFVANASDDSVSVVDVSKSKVLSTIPLGRMPVPLDERDLGEQLFHDARLSLDGWYSCQSCHPDGHTNGRRNDNLSDGSFGTPKQIPSLLGVEETRPWGWNGSMQTHEMQVHQSILGTMRGPATGATADNVNAIAAYIRSLPPAPSLAAARGEPTNDTDPAVTRGREIFSDLRCGRCHNVPEYTSERTYEIGLPDEAGRSSFNPPSLQGVSQREVYLHDGRARTLGEVFTKHGHPQGKGTEGESVEDLVAFLRTL